MSSRALGPLTRRTIGNLILSHARPCLKKYAGADWTAHRGHTASMSAYMSTRHVKPPAAPLFLLFFLFFLGPPLSLVRPRRRLSLAPTAGCCRRRAQGVSRLAAFQRPPSGSAFTRPSTTAGLMGSVDCSCPVTYPSACQRALFRSRMCFRQVLLRSPWRVRCSHQLISGSSDPACQGAACMDDRAGGMGLIFLTADWQTPICDADIQPHIQPARHTRLGCRNSAHCRRYRVRVAPCGTRPCSR